MDIDTQGFWVIFMTLHALQVKAGPSHPIDSGTDYAKLGDSFRFLCRDNVTATAQLIEIKLWEVPGHAEYKYSQVLWKKPNGKDARIDRTLPQVKTNRLSVSCRSVQEENKAVTECLLTVSNLTKSDFGKYGCHRVVENTNERTGDTEDIGSTIVKVLKQALPADAPSLTVPELQEHEPGSVICSSSGGQPAPHFSWSLNGTTIISGSSNETLIDGGASTSTLTWSSVPRQLSGLLRCSIKGISVVDGRSEVEKTVVVSYCTENLILRPSLAPTSSLRVLENNSVTLSCSASGRPEPTFVWKHGNTSVSRSAQLTLTDLSRAHSGNYTCRALQSDVTGCSPQTGRMDLDVLYGPTSINISEKSEHVIEKETLHLKCSSDCNPACTFNWTQPSAAAAPVQGAELTVSNVSRDYFGRYTCYASNTQEPSVGQGLQRTGIATDYVNVSVAFGPDSMTGVLMFNSSNATRSGHSSYGLVAAVDFDVGAVRCSSAQCQPAAACSYWWDTGVNPLQLGRLTTEGLTTHECRAKNSITKRTEIVANLSVYAHGAASNLAIDDVTAHSAALNFTLGFTGGMAHHVSAEWKLQTEAGWAAVDRITEKTNSTLRVWLPQPGMQIHVRLISQITGEEQSKATSANFNVSLEDVPTFPRKPTVQPNGNEAKFTFSYTGGSPRSARVCASKKKSSEKCDASTTENLPTGKRRKRNNMHEITITGLDGSAAQLWYQLSLYDGPDFLNKTEWINGGAAKQLSPKQGFPAAAVGGGVGAFLLLLCLVVVILVVFRLRKAKTANENQHGNNVKRQIEDACEDVDLEMSPYSVGYPGLATDKSEKELNGIQNGIANKDVDFEISPYSTGYSSASNNGTEETADTIPVYAKVKKKGKASSSLDAAEEEVPGTTANGDVKQPPAIYTKPKKKVTAPAVYSKVNKKKNKDKAGPSQADSTEEDSFNVYEDIGKPSEGKKQKARKRAKKAGKGKKSKSAPKQAPDGAEYSNLTPEVAYANVEQKKPEQVYSNINAPKKLTDVIVDSAKEHQDWKENQQGLVYADVQTSRPALPEGQEQPVHTAADNTTYAAVDFSRSGAANI